MAAELANARAQVASLAAASEKQAELMERQAEEMALEMERRAHTLLREREAEVARLLASEGERYERLRHFNDVARGLMREELKALDHDVEERLRATLDDDTNASNSSSSSSAQRDGPPKRSTSLTGSGKAVPAAFSSGRRLSGGAKSPRRQSVMSPLRTPRALVRSLFAGASDGRGRRASTPSSARPSKSDRASHGASTPTTPAASQPASRQATPRSSHS